MNWALPDNHTRNRRADSNPRRKHRDILKRIAASDRAHEEERHLAASHIAILHKDPNSDFGVSFPDFPGYFGLLVDGLLPG